MPIRAHPTQPGSKTLLCVNCPDTLLNMPLSRFHLKPDAGFGKPEVLTLFAAVCDSCGYTELYKEGLLFESGSSERGEK